LGSGRWSWSRSWVGISLIKSGGLEREGGRDTRAAFTRAIQVLETDDGGRDASLLVLDGVSKREIDLDRRVVERMTELRIAGQGVDEVISQRWAGARNSRDLAVEVWTIAVTKLIWVVVWLRSELRGELSHIFAGNARGPVVVRGWSRSRGGLSWRRCGRGCGSRCGSHFRRGRRRRRGCGRRRSVGARVNSQRLCGDCRRDIGASDTGAFEVLDGNCRGSEASVLVLLRVSRGEGYLDRGVVDSMAGLYIGNQLLQELFPHRRALTGNPLLLPIGLNGTETFGADRFLIGDCPKVRCESPDVCL